MKRISYLILLSLLLLVVSSSLALAAVPAPSSVGDMLSKVLNFFKYLFTGKANLEDTYFIVFILYFVIFLAIFMEALKFISFFGERGTVSKQGKVFAVAAAALSTLALFLIDSASGTTGISRLESLVAPFGVWGAVVLAVVIAWITYQMFKDTAVFREEIMTSMAIAGAVGVTFAGFLLSMDQLVGWGFFILLLVFLVGAIRAGVSQMGKTSEEKKEEREREIPRFKEMAKAQKTGEEMARRAKEVREPKSYLVDAIEDCKKLINSLAVRSPEERAAAVKRAENISKSLRNNLRRAVRSLRYLRRKERGHENARIYEIFDNLHTNAGVALTYAKQISIPKPNVEEQEWRNAYNEIRQLAGTIGGLCGQMVNALNVFMEHQNLEAAQAAAGQGLVQQAQERAQQQEQRQEAAQQRVQEQAAGSSRPQQQSAQARRQRMVSRPVATIKRKR